MIIRRASAEESATLTQLAHSAKRFWGYPENWLRQWQADLTITPDFITQNLVCVAEDGGELRGFYALVVRNEKAELEHMWVSPEAIGKGVGKELFIHAMQKAAGENVTEIEISSDPNAEGFYQKMGATRVGEVVSEVDGHERVLPRMKIDPRLS